ncbi:hypothetical protein QNO08_10115 [Arthrobacter sp. zg-Y820]|uniref:hypothetical protein n=1 Tax=unclassified Arthrobacter TaxID=235627 RepID=UPI001E2C02C1|nr:MULTISPECIES: hypothetical protein [unclassified Arthrobacter]MCC9196525.1 hypothetical protein [Arthrobacter sp. zg-Y820]MDK1279387.1 hypothetical protein [Arthrobacter sp. zg.Y820]WIB08230.1 hypothetical protein QNO08_10115 [Arthrobacter sp. zg-Y820]
MSGERRGSCGDSLFEFAEGEAGAAVHYGGAVRKTMCGAPRQVIEGGCGTRGLAAMEMEKLTLDPRS